MHVTEEQLALYVDAPVSDHAELAARGYSGACRGVFGAQDEDHGDRRTA